MFHILPLKSQFISSHLPAAAVPLCVQFTHSVALIFHYFYSSSLSPGTSSSNNKSSPLLPIPLIYLSSLFQFHRHRATQSETTGEEQSRIATPIYLRESSNEEPLSQSSSEPFLETMVELEDFICEAQLSQSRWSRCGKNATRRPVHANQIMATLQHFHSPILKLQRERNRIESMDRMEQKQKRCSNRFDKIS